MLKLIELQEKDLEKIKPGLLEIKENPTPYDILQSQKAIEFMDKNFDGYLDFLKKRKSEKQPEGYVPATTLFLFDDDNFIGLYDIRHRLNDFLMKHGGNIAYQIIPSQRRKGYVKAGLKLVLKWCHDNLGMEKALLFCNSQNIASYKAMISVMNEMGGQKIPDGIVDGHIECGVWINTKK